MPNDYYSSLKVHGYDTHPSDHVHHPSHYQIGGIETIKLLKSVLPKQEYIGFLKGNIIKYRERAPFKGNEEQDYAKARTYMRLLEEVENE